MSNVLIGIIGVILFIGLALAGALFLGPRFQESTNNSRASAAVQAVSQVANAYNMHQVQEGTSAADVDELVTDGYLKSVPANATGGTPPALGADGTAGYVTMALSTNADKVCEAIVKQTQGVDTVPATFDAATAGVAGCYGDAGTFEAYAAL